MYNKLEKELLNKLMMVGGFKLQVIQNDQTKLEFSTLQKSSQDIDEIIVLIEDVNYDDAKDTIDSFIKQYYTGNKGISLNFIIYVRENSTYIREFDSFIENSFIKSTALILVDEARLQVTELEGYSPYCQFLKTYMHSQNSLSKKQIIFSYPVTTALIVINILIFITMLIKNNYKVDFTVELLLDFGAMSYAKVKMGEYFRLITAVFIHTGIIHLAFNMYALKVIGSLMEELYGKIRFLFIYFTAGITGALFSFYFTKGVSAGASGAIFGLLGAALIYGYKMKNKQGIGFYKSIFQVILINLIIGMSLPNIDNFAHVGGLLGGVVSTTIIEILNKD